VAGVEWDDERARRQVARAEELLSGLETLPDSAAAARAAETVETLVGLYGECLARIMDHLARTGGDDDGGGDVRRLAADELVGHLLLVHDLHPDPPETRARRVLDELRPHLRSLGTELEVLEVSAARVRVRVTGGGGGCSSSSACGSTWATSRESAEQAVRDAVGGCAPEIGSVEIESAGTEGAGTGPAAAPQTFIPVDALFQGRTLTGRGTG
jgi:Fe-S cluster biogenesis protein NfuA